MTCPSLRCREQRNPRNPAHFLEFVVSVRRQGLEGISDEMYEVYIMKVIAGFSEWSKGPISDRGAREVFEDIASFFQGVYHDIQHELILRPVSADFYEALARHHFQYGRLTEFFIAMIKSVVFGAYGKDIPRDDELMGKFEKMYEDLKKKLFQRAREASHKRLPEYVDLAHFFLRDHGGHLSTFMSLYQIINCGGRPGDRVPSLQSQSFRAMLTGQNEILGILQRFLGNRLIQEVFREIAEDLRDTDTFWEDDHNPSVNREGDGGGGSGMAG